MGEHENTGEKVLLYVFVGIGIAALAYLFFKDQFRRDNTVQSSAQSVGLGSLGSLSGIRGFERTSSQLALSNPRIDELEKQTIDLEMQTNALKERLKLYDYKLNQYGNQSIDVESIPRTYNLSGQPARAGSVTTIRTTSEDKVRQKDFGMN